MAKQIDNHLLELYSIEILLIIKSNISSEDKMKQIVKILRNIELDTYCFIRDNKLSIEQIQNEICGRVNNG